MSDDLIRRSDAIDAIEITPFEDYGDYIKASELIKRLPTVEPKRGKWLWDKGYFCSECHEEAFSQKFTMFTDDPMYFPTTFCPWCGADMRGKHDE